ncbi:endolytic transglycosylase MltG [Helicobacter cinaedi]|uniref:Endolytic murein transglycosylase n=1 Tax=Helicobacter cinaedi CCUG 18818 = ATCC BAA-847 TaxID=537971 RepID=A0ABN0B8C5_9HELI|nr:endolytic transglycosylase MltG [Helicobacter cinaedi]EFR45658.1 YceG family protein [Helicobacter cinaedi CCUG 18818 = ATCC BAA-847]QOQ91045.1 endolytic transglycosylase MltG [Helicobacter cinaedi]
MPKKTTILTICFDLFFIIAITILFYLLQPVQTERILNLPKGSLPKIITYLNENGGHYNKLDSLFIRLLGQPQSGFIDMKAGVLPKGAFFKALVSSKAATKDVTLIPGETMYFFIRILADTFNLSPESLQVAYDKYFPYPDGMIFPDTYSLPVGIDSDELMKLLYDISIKRHEQNAIRLLGAYNQEEWFKNVSIASVVQKEAANNQEMPIVAAVVFNRLEKNMPLQMDGSLNYGQYSHSKVTPERIRNDDTPYNTYRNKGVPPYPAGSVSIQAIEAVLKPAQVDYLYFVRDRSTGTHKFSKTYDEHRSHF